VNKFIAAVIAALVLTVLGSAGSAFAGEVTGNGKPTPIREGRAASECSFSGVEDWNSAEPQDPEDAIMVTPGVTQTPHSVLVGGEVFYPPPGTPGFACSPGRPTP